MSYTISTDIFCDHPGCGVWETEATVTGNKPMKREAWRVAKNIGWTKTGDRHYCLSHSTFKLE